MHTHTHTHTHTECDSGFYTLLCVAQGSKGRNLKQRTCGQEHLHIEVVANTADEERFFF